MMIYYMWSKNFNFTATRLTLAWVASVSARVRRESWEESKKRNDGGGGGERRNRLPANPTIFKNYVRPRTQLLIGAVMLSARNINQTRYALFTCVTDLVSSDLWSQITNSSDWYLFESCLCEGLWDQSLQSIIEDRAVETREGQFIENDGVRIWLEKMDCLLEITST